LKRDGKQIRQGDRQSEQKHTWLKHSIPPEGCLLGQSGGYDTTFRVGKQKNGRRFQKASFLATEESRYWARHQSDSSHHPHTMKMINPDELSSEVEVVTSCSS